MNRFFISLIALTAAAGSFAAPIHNDVKKLDFAAVRVYLAQGGDVNLPEEASGKSPLAIAIEQALPKSFEAKNYPFDKRTFMFIKKLISCGLTSGVKKATQYMVFDNPQGDVVVDTLSGNEGLMSATCNEAGECAAEKPGEAPVEPSCITQDEVTEFLSQVRRDAPNCVTSVTDILAAANDFLFDNILFYEATGEESPQINMIKLLLSNGAKLETSTHAFIKNHAQALDTSSNLAISQAGVRTVGNFAVFAVTALVQNLFVGPQAQRVVRYPMNAAYYMIGVKAVMDIRNFVAAWAHLDTAYKVSKNLHEVISNPQQPPKK